MKCLPQLRVLFYTENTLQNTQHYTQLFLFANFKQHSSIRNSYVRTSQDGSQIVQNQQCILAYILSATVQGYS